MSPSPVARTDTQRLRRTAILLGVQSGSVAAVIVVALVGTALFVVLHSQRATSEQLLAKAVARADDVNDPPAGVWLTIRNGNGQASSPGIPAGFPDRAAIDEVARSGGLLSAAAEVGGEDYLVRTEQRGTEVVQAVLDLKADNAERDRLVEALTISGVVGLALAVAAGLLLGMRAMRPLLETVALQRRFVADASHELRTPLTLLSTRAQLLRRDLRRGADPGALDSEVDGLVADADNLALVLEDLLMAADRRPSDPADRVDLAAMAADVVAAYGPGASAGVAVSCARPPGPVVVVGTAPALRRALTALLDNAVRHALGQVVVTVSTQNGDALVEVRDDGPGIDPAMLPRLFERHESSGAREQVRRSYGLGLALLSDVVSQHHGTVTARNLPRLERGEASGAVLLMRFPLAAQR